MTAADRRVLQSSLTVRSLPGIEGAREVWTALAAQSDNLFSTWEWGSVWWKHFGPGRTLRLTQVEDSTGTPIALLPTCGERRGGISLVRFIGHGLADQLGPVCAPEHALSALSEIEEAGGRRLMLAERLPQQLAGQLEHGTVLRSEPSPMIQLDGIGGWDGYLTSRTNHFRKQTRQRARTLAGTFSLRLADDPDRLAADMESLIGLHSLRWGAESASFGGARGAFHREFAAVALKRGWLRLWLAESDGKAVAAWYGFRFAGVEYFYQSGRDPHFDRLSIGSALVEHSIRAAIEEGMHEYRMLRGDESYKRRYATSSRGVVTVALPRGVMGRLVVNGAVVLLRRPRAQRLLRAMPKAAGLGA